MKTRPWCYTSKYKWKCPDSSTYRSIALPGHQQKERTIVQFIVLFSLESLSAFCLLWKRIMKTRLFKYIENFTSKTGKFPDKTFWYFSYFCSKHRLLVLVRTASARSSNEYPQSIFSKIRTIKFTPCKPQFYFIKVGVKCGGGGGCQNYICVFLWWNTA